MEIFEYPILNNKHYQQPSVFRPENLIREARRQKGLKTCNVPKICVLDPDGDLAECLIQNEKANENNCWACYHSSLYNFQLQGSEIGVVPHAVGAAYAVLVAKQLFQSGCELLISITSAGLIDHPKTSHKFELITEAVRDEGMAQNEGDFEKGEYFGSLDSLEIVAKVLSIYKKHSNILNNDKRPDNP